MQFSIEIPQDAAGFSALFEETFTASDGAAEGAAVGRLVADILRTSSQADRVVCVAREAGELIGCIIFTPLRFAGDARRVWLLSPVAVRPDRQGLGIGQKLIRHGLDMLAAQGADVVVTYGDPAFYGRTGFAPVSVADLPAPMPLSQPQGWLAQSLTGTPLAAFAGPSSCEPAFQNAALW